MSGSVLALIDGHSLAFRAFHALPLSLTGPDGELTNAVFGFTSMLLNVLRDQQPEYVAVAFDVGKTFRHEMYADYKGHRERMPDELRTQVERIKEVVDALNIPIFTREGFEADDVLATLARQAEAQGVASVIVTGDRDILQVVDGAISVLTSGRQFSDTIIYTPGAVEEKYGLRPDQLVDLKALVGDKSDNIPGVHGIGEKGATTLLQKYGTLDAVYAHLDEVTPERTRKALDEGRELPRLSRTLGRIITDVPIRLDLAACRTRDYDRSKVVALFQDLAFRSLVDRLPASRRPAGHGRSPLQATPKRSLPSSPPSRSRRTATGDPASGRCRPSACQPSAIEPAEPSVLAADRVLWPAWRRSSRPQPPSRSTPRSTSTDPQSGRAGRAGGGVGRGAGRGRLHPAGAQGLGRACPGRRCARRCSPPSPTPASPRSPTTPATTSAC